MGHAEAGGCADGGDGDKVKEAQLLSVSWNQDNSCFAAATTADFRVFTCDPFGETTRRVREGGGEFAIAEMLFRSNIFAVDGGGDKFKVAVWDDHARKLMWHNRFSTAVRAVRMSRERLAVVVDRMVKVYDLPMYAAAAAPTTAATRSVLLRKIETAPNPRGLCCLSCRSDATTVLACPGTKRGQVRVEHLGRMTTSRFIEAHSSEVACMAMTVDGAVLATASVRGTLVRVFSTGDGTCLQEVRRGIDSAEIYSIALSRKLQWLAVSSDKGTLHVFRLRVRDEQSAAAGSLVQTNGVSNAKSSLSFMKGILPNYFSSEWSFAQFRLPEGTRYTAAFGKQNTVMVIGMDGSFYKCSFDPVNGGEMARKEYFRFLNDKNTPPIRILTT